MAIINKSSYSDEKIDKAIHEASLYDNPEETLQSVQDSLPGTKITMEEGNMVIRNVNKINKS